MLLSQNPARPRPLSTDLRRHKNHSVQSALSSVERSGTFSCHSPLQAPKLSGTNTYTFDLFVPRPCTCWLGQASHSPPRFCAILLKPLHESLVSATPSSTEAPSEILHLKLCTAYSRQRVRRQKHKGLHLPTAAQPFVKESSRSQQASKTACKAFKACSLKRPLSPLAWNCQLPSGGFEPHATVEGVPLGKRNFFLTSLHVHFGPLPSGQSRPRQPDRSSPPGGSKIAGSDFLRAGRRVEQIRRGLDVPRPDSTAFPSRNCMLVQLNTSQGSQVRNDGRKDASEIEENSSIYGYIPPRLVSTELGDGWLLSQVTFLRRSSFSTNLSILSSSQDKRFASG